MEFHNIGKQSSDVVAANSAAITQRKADVEAFISAVKVHWTSEDIAQWAVDTFGETVSAMRVATRANEEMAELLRELSSDTTDAKVAEEAADVVIVLARVFQLMGTTMEKAVARKMGINLARTWKRDATGHGYHVKTLANADAPSFGLDVPGGGAIG